MPPINDTDFSPRTGCHLEKQCLGEPICGTVRVGINQIDKVAYVVFRENGTHKPRMVAVVDPELPHLVNYEDFTVALSAVERHYEWEIQPAGDVVLKFAGPIPMQDFLACYDASRPCEPSLEQ